MLGTHLRSTPRLVLLCLLVLNGCSTHHPFRPPAGDIIPFVHAFETGIDDSPLMACAASDKANGTQQVAMLNIGVDALLARIHLIRSAKVSIQVQTLIWRNDEVGRYLMYELISAAYRGVHVRLIIDHIASDRDPDIAAYLASVHPNLRVKIYNPVASWGLNPKMDPSQVEMAGGVLTRFGKINQRMHNKVFIVDDLIGITGGRNCENAYYDQSTTLNFKDRDVLLTGSAVEELEESFHHYWSHQLSVDIAKLTDVSAIRERGEVQQWNSKTAFALNGWFDQMDAMAEDASVVKSKFIDAMIKVEHATIIADAPGKNTKEWFGRFIGAGSITIALAELLSNAQQSILIQTPYLVLSGPAIDLFRKIRRQHPDIDIRISTNSLAATDSWHTYAISYQQKQTYLRELDFIIYEFKPYPGDMRQFMPQWDLLRHRNTQIKTMTPTAAEDHSKTEGRWDILQVDPGYTNTQPMNEPYLCLHAKSMVVDGEIAFIGSYNLDPRSENLNTEIGLVIRDRAFARMLKANILIDTQPENAWVIARNDYPVILEETNAVLDVFSRWLPIIDPWPIRYAGSYELRLNKTPVDPTHPDFYDRYRYVGNFPEVGMARLDKIMGTWLMKSIGSITKPLL